MKNILKDIWTSRELARMLLIRNLRAKYRQAVFGLLWAFAPPLVLSVIWIFLRSQNVTNFGDTTVPYPIYVISGVFIWQTFADAIFAPILAIQANKPVITKIFFRREAMFSAAFLEVLFDFGVRLILLFGLYLYFDHTVFTGFLFVISAIIFIALFGFALGCLLAPIGTLITDVSKGLNVLLTFWFFMTPVIYPRATEGLAGLVMTWNPATHLVETGRQILIQGTMQTSSAFVLLAGVAVIITLLSLYILRISFPHLITRIGN